MRSKKVKLVTVLLLVLGLTGLHAQETIITTGNNASGNSGSISYSVGQLVCKTNSGTNGIENQGVQQPYEISIVAGIEFTSNIDLSIIAYPNPVNDYLTLSIDNFEVSDLSYQLFNTAGKLLQTKKVEANKTSISLVNLIAVTYFLEVTQNNEKIKTFKIIKTK